MLPRIPRVTVFLRQSLSPRRVAATTPRHFTTSLPVLHRSPWPPPRAPRAARTTGIAAPLRSSKSKSGSGSDSESESKHNEEEFREDETPPAEKGHIIGKLFLLVATPIVFLNTLTYSQQLASVFSLSEHQQHALREYMVKNFAIVPFMFTSPDFVTPWWALITHQFSHMGVLHFLFSYVALSSFAPTLATRYGTGRTIGAFLAAGSMAGVLSILYYKLTNPYAGLTERELNQLVNSRKPDGSRYMEDRNLRLMISPHLGSSGAIIGLTTILALIAPALEINLMFIPYGIPIRNCMLGLAAFDLGGTFYDYGLGIAHAGHLGGNIAGLLLYFFWLRRIPPQFILNYIKKAGL